MYIVLDVTGQGTGASDFLKALPKLLQNTTWTLVSQAPLSATIQSTATISALPSKPEYLLKEAMGGAGSVTATLTNKGFSTDQEAEAARYLLYLCATALKSYAKNIKFSW